MSEHLPIERRHDARFALKAAVSMRLPGEPRTPGRLLDISRTGCRLMTHRPLATGTGFWLMVGNLEPRFCHIVWAHERFAGARFAVELEAPALKRLTEEFSPLSERDAAELQALSAKCSQLARSATGGSAADHLATLADDCEAEAIAFAAARQRERVEELLKRLSVAGD
ncbi:PilZ domain-containing protein [Sphingosinithalassobacter sp. LHW66-3]|uniref:PilZ domain-containing protein n=1 Tax=Sphingosinithalassobacter sp. LHW66-3 TaxID=3424718 RepID=UPI003D6B693D